MAARILETNNYGKFVLSNINRNIHKTWHLEASMKKYGFRDACPIEVTRLANGLLEIQDGHHRYYVARKLRIPVKYVEVKEVMTMTERAKTTTAWSLRDYLDSYVRAGLPAYVEVKKYHDRTGIGLSACISMLAGDSAGSGNWNSQFKDGTFRLADSIHADIVGEISLHCKKCGVPFFKNQIFINALSKIVWAEGFDPEVLKNKLTHFSEYLKKQPTKDDYVRLLDEIYNRKSQTKVPLTFRAEEAARKRERGGVGSKAAAHRAGASA